MRAKRATGVSDCCSASRSSISVRIRVILARRHGSRRFSVNVPLVSLFPFELLHVIRGGVLTHGAVDFHDLVEGGIDIFRHPFGVAANVEMRSVLEPRPEFCTVRVHPMLHINLLGLIARKRRRQRLEMPVALHGLELVAIEKIGSGALFTKKKPAAPACTDRTTFVKKRAERRYAGAGSDHDDRGVTVRWKTEGVRGLHEDRHGSVRALRQEAGADAF